MKLPGIFRAMARVLIGSAGSVAMLVAVPAQSASLTIDDGGACASWTWNSTTRTLSCGSVPPPPPPAGAPTGCVPSISTNPATLSSGGGTATLNVSGCVPSTGISYAWTKNGASFSSAQSLQDTLAANTSTTTAATTSYQVNVCNGSACTGTIPATPLTATVPAASAGGGGGVTAKSCAAQGFAKTIWYDWDWAGTVPQLDTAYLGNTEGGTGIGTNGILVVAFTPTGPADVNNLSYLDAIGYPSPNQGNIMTLSVSTKPCDLSIPEPGTSVSYAPTVTYGIGTVGVRWWDNKPTAQALTPGVRYYINVAGRNGGAETCIPGVFGSCELRLALRKPAGH